MITKDNVTYRAFEGDCHPVNVFVGENKVAGYVSETAEGQELELSNTYNDSYEDLKVFGKSEQKAKWNQAEGVTTQAGTPSPESPIDLVSNIPAGSYQIPTENGIYEVTLTEDLRGLDDTYRDKICFDSISGTGYLEQNTQEVNWQNSELASFSILTDETLHYGLKIPVDKKKIKSNQVKCTHFPYINGDLYHATKDSIVLYSYTDTEYSLFIDIRKEYLDITDYTNRTENALSFLRWVAVNNPVCILPRTTPLKTALTFTKVTSSTLPVLPWTAYGSNLFDGVFESGFYDENGAVRSTNYIRSVNYIPVQPNTQYYFLNNKDDDTFLWYDGGKTFISKVSDLSAPSPANARYMRFFFYGTDLTTKYMICSGAKPTAYEPFNPTPPESLIPSPDYPHQIYDLKDVTVTSRGRNLWKAGDITLTNYANSATNYLDISALESGKTYFWICNVEVLSGDISSAIPGQLRLIGSDNTKRIIWNPNESKEIPNDWDLTRNTFNLYGAFGEGEKLVNITNAMFAEGTELSFRDKYRCTLATIPIALKSCGDDKDYIVSDGQAVKLNPCVKEILIDGTTNNFVCNIFGSVSEPMCEFYVMDTSGYDSIKGGSVVLNSHGFVSQAKSEGDIYFPYIKIPWSVLGLASVPTVTQANEAAKNYCAAQNALGTPLIMRYVLYTLVETEITDTWAQDMIGLKTAPYWTKIYTDKETGGISATYKHF